MNGVREDACEGPAAKTGSCQPRVGEVGGGWGAVNVRIRGRRGQPTHLEVRPAQRPLRVPPFRLLLLGDKRRRLRHHHRREMKRTTAPPRGSLAVLRERRSRSWDAALRLQGRRGGVGERFKTCLVYLYDIICSL